MAEVARLRWRYMFAIFLLGQPNVAELHVSITYAQWHLALLAFLVLIALPPERTAGKIFDCCVLALCSASGPFCILLLPSALLVWFVDKKRWQTIRLAILITGSVLQGASLLLSQQHGRSHAPLGASWQLLFRILAGQVILPVFQGSNRLQHWAHSNKQGLVVAILLTGLGVAASLWAFWRGSTALRAFLMFAGVVLVCSLLSPMGSLTRSQWEAISAPGAAGRYWYLPSLGVACVVFWMTSPARPVVMRFVAVLLLCFVSAAVVRSWRYPPLPNLDFPRYAAAFATVPRGAEFTIPINPSGWEMRLIKR